MQGHIALGGRGGGMQEIYGFSLLILLCDEMPFSFSFFLYLSFLSSKLTVRYARLALQTIKS